MFIFENIQNKITKRLIFRLHPLFSKLYLSQRYEQMNKRMYNKKTKTPLSIAEIDEAKRFWGKQYGRGKYETYAFYKSFCGVFDVRYMPNDYYFQAEYILNLRWAAYFLQHKCCLDQFVPNEFLPQTILKGINGHIIYKNEYITASNAIKVLKEKKDFVFKIARGTGGGKGIIKVGASTPSSIFEEIIARKDFVCQEIIEQCDFMSSFNPDSVNTIRMLTLNINDKCTMLSSFIRMGGVGSFVDNLASSGGTLVGVDASGNLCSWGVNKTFEKRYKSPTGIEFHGKVIPDFQHITDQIINMHKRIPYADLIAWDIAISKNGTPIVIEINLDAGEVEAHQIFNGPVFGDRTLEVLEFVSNRSASLKPKVIPF